jgi:hypothetical protein
MEGLVVAVGTKGRSPHVGASHNICVEQNASLTVDWKSELFSWYLCGLVPLGRCFRPFRRGIGLAGRATLGLTEGVELS